MKTLWAIAGFVGIAGALVAQSSLTAEIDRREKLVASKVVAWRRDIHEHPELANREVRTSKLVADHLRSLRASSR